MFNKHVDVNVTTRVENEDNIKICRLIETYVKSGTSWHMQLMNDGSVKITFTTLKSLVDQFKHDILILNLAGVKGRVTA
jgi:hypothetical protein